LAAWREHQIATGRGNPASDFEARRFLTRWPDPRDWAAEPLPVRMATPPSAISLLMFVMCRGWCQPGWDWLGLFEPPCSLWDAAVGGVIRR